MRCSGNRRRSGSDVPSTGSPELNDRRWTWIESATFVAPDAEEGNLTARALVAPRAAPWRRGAGSGPRRARSLRRSRSRIWRTGVSARRSPSGTSMTAGTGFSCEYEHMTLELTVPISGEGSLAGGSE